MPSDLSHSPEHRATDVLVERDGGVTTIVLNRPDRRNAVDGPMAAQLREAFVRFEADDTQRVAILWGAGGTFCAGADLTAVADPHRRHELDPAGGGCGPMGPTRMALSKPLIAAVSGYAVAGGLELALLADLRICEQDSTFGVFCRRWGVPLIDGGTVRLPRIVGQGRALDMILTGRPVGADEALSFGLVNRIVETGTSLEAARGIADQLLEFPQECMLADRISTYRSFDMPLDAALRAEGAAGAPIVDREGVTGAARFVSGAGRHGSFTRTS
ncbi:crotonase/enoyl-CoA hydratase family protein [Nocardia africana]|uniref:Carnitinyl-CoA dehydratase n=1 Tax=Nocardia africana TaxID=134964 RepID=A0A378WY96_9NOCA|nr:crotonase/enoyl-CoA hydratase family protein [Nocardia africana]MCC3312941.1 crotonase/enoyl-CoA hydratase family protein [Nocardia africana]SUA45717.1 Carnitinyl-CoA dehydratase [Nocardia africana]